MTNGRDDNDLELLLNAYLDGELDPITARKVEARLKEEPRARSEFAELERLRDSFRAEAGNDFASESLRRKIEALAKPPLGERTWSWHALAASALVGAVLAGSGTFGLIAGRHGDATTDILVQDHIRALMAPSQADVASSDHHTVKPWFAGKLTYAPEVAELTAQGFQLVGGRVDVVDFEPVPTLVYRIGKHLVSLTAIPDRGGDMIARNRDIRGFHALEWQQNGVGYIAVSDAAPDELAAFAAAFRAATGAK